MGCGHLLQVDRGVHVAVMLCPAAPASPATVAEVKICVSGTAGGACLARWVEPISQRDVAAGQGGLVHELVPDLGHCSIKHRLGKPAPGHSFHTQIFNSDPPKVMHQPSREVVRHVLSNVSDMLVQATQLDLRLPPVGPSPCASRELFVEHAQLGLVLPQRTRCSNPSTVTQDSEVNDSEVYSHRGLGFTGVRVGPRLVDLDRQGDAPASDALGEPGGEDLAWETKGLKHADPAEFGQLDLSAVESEPPGLDGKAFAALSALFEPWIAGLVTLLDPAEEVGECRSEISECVVGYRPREFAQPSKVSFLAGVELGVDALPTRLTPTLIYLLPASHPVVPCAPGSTSAPLEKRSLDVVGIKPDALAEYQAPISLRSMRRTISPMDTSRRLASSRSHASNGGSRWISRRRTFMRFFGGGMGGTVAAGMSAVNSQLPMGVVGTDQIRDVANKHGVRRET